MGNGKKWMVMVDLYKPSGKWYAGGTSRIQANPWDDRETILAAFWAEQDIVQTADGGEYYTIVLTDLPESMDDPNYDVCWKRVLQIGRRTLQESAS